MQAEEVAVYEQKNDNEKGKRNGRRTNHNRNATIFKERDHLGLVCCGCTNDKTAFGTQKWWPRKGNASRESETKGLLAYVPSLPRKRASPACSLLAQRSPTRSLYSSGQSFRRKPTRDTDTLIISFAITPSHQKEPSFLLFSQPPVIRSSPMHTVFLHHDKSPTLLCLL